MDYRGYDLVTPTSGGKAGRGRNKTSTVQVIQRISGGNYLLLKQVKFIMGDHESVRAATIKAMRFVDNLVDKRIGAL